MLNKHLISLDVDWAPDDVIEEISSTLVQKEVKATWGKIAL